MVQHIFVYGTLKTGQCRERLWPCSPTEFRRAWTLGKLYDLGPYPAMILGSDRIAGQVWAIRDEDMEQTCKVLDEIEGTNQAGCANLYDRVQVDVVLLDSGERLRASTYIYAKPEQLANSQVAAPSLMLNQQAYCIWPPGSTWQ